jgi:hypothetical protein
VRTIFVARCPLRTCRPPHMRSLLVLFLVLGAPVTADTPAPTLHPSRTPSYKPTKDPTRQPTARPTHQPTNFPTLKPTRMPTAQVTSTPSSQPTVKPTHQPTFRPTRRPVPTSRSPTSTFLPSHAPSEAPSQSPSRAPSLAPTPPTTKAPAIRLPAGCVPDDSLTGTFLEFIYVNPKSTVFNVTFNAQAQCGGPDHGTCTGINPAITTASTGHCMCTPSFSGHGDMFNATCRSCLVPVSLDQAVWILILLQYLYLLAYAWAVWLYLYKECQVVRARLLLLLQSAESFVCIPLVVFMCLLRLSPWLGLAHQRIAYLDKPAEDNNVSCDQLITSWRNFGVDPLLTYCFLAYVALHQTCTFWITQVVLERLADDAHPNCWKENVDRIRKKIMKRSVFFVFGLSIVSFAGLCDVMLLSLSNSQSSSYQNLVYQYLLIVIKNILMFCVCPLLNWRRLYLLGELVDMAPSTGERNRDVFLDQLNRATKSSTPGNFCLMYIAFGVLFSMPFFAHYQFLAFAFYFAIQGGEGHVAVFAMYYFKPKKPHATESEWAHEHFREQMELYTSVEFVYIKGEEGRNPNWPTVLRLWIVNGLRLLVYCVFLLFLVAARVAYKTNYYVNVGLQTLSAPLTWCKGKWNELVVLVKCENRCQIATRQKPEKVYHKEPPSNIYFFLCHVVPECFLWCVVQPRKRREKRPKIGQVEA